jgi:hypothetical protein
MAAGSPSRAVRPACASGSVSWTGSLYGIAISRREVCAALPDLGVSWTDPLPPGACAALALGDVASLHRLVRRAF